MSSSDAFRTGDISIVTPVPVTGPLTDSELRAAPVEVTTTVGVLATSVVTRDPSSLTSVMLVAANPLRRGLLFYNDGDADQFIKFGVTASMTDFTVRLTKKMFYEVAAPIYVGRMDVISSTTSGAIQVTDLS